MVAESKNLGALRSWKKGDAIEARRLDNMVRDINNNSEGLGGPRQKPGFAQSSDATVEDQIFNEVSRIESTYEITDSNGDTFEVAQIDQVVMQSEQGITFTFNFDNE